MSIRTVIVVTACLGLLLGGCAETPLKIPPPSDKARAEFGTVAVAPVRLGRKEEVQKLGADIARSEGQGAAEGVKWAFEPVSEVCGSALPTAGSGAVCGIIIAYSIVAAPFAAVVGAIRARPASEVEAAERSLLAAFNRMNPRTVLRDQIILAGKSMTGLKIVSIDDERPEALFGGSTTGFDSIMTLFFNASLLFDDDNMNPGVTLDLQVTASIARATDESQLHFQIWRYWSEKEEFFDLAENGARRFEEVIAEAYDPLARKIVHDLFIASAPEIQSPGEPGTAWAVGRPPSSVGGTAAPAHESMVRATNAETEGLSSNSEGSIPSASPFDGAWFLEIGEASAMHQRDIVRTVVSDGRFSARFETDRWRGQLRGEINEGGSLVAQGTVEKIADGANWYRGALQFTASYQDGGFRSCGQNV